LKDYFIIEREVPGNVNVHSATLINVGDLLSIETAKELYKLAFGEPNYSLTIQMDEYQRLLDKKIDINDLLENLQKNMLI